MGLVDVPGTIGFQTFQAWQRLPGIRDGHGGCGHRQEGLRVLGSRVWVQSLLFLLCVPGHHELHLLHHLIHHLNLLSFVPFLRINRGKHATYLVRGIEIRVWLHLYLRSVSVQVGITCVEVPARLAYSQMLGVRSSNDHGRVIKHLLALHSVLLGIE